MFCVCCSISNWVKYVCETCSEREEKMARTTRLRTIDYVQVPLKYGNGFSRSSMDKLYSTQNHNCVKYEWSGIRGRHAQLGLVLISHVKSCENLAMSLEDLVRTKCCLIMMKGP